MHADSTPKPVALVTGASSGIGEAIARRFAEGGFRIVAVARRQERLEQLAASLDTDVEILAADVTAADTADRAVQLAMDAFGRLDCLVNNAGSGKWAPVDQTDDQTLDEVVETSLKAPFRFARAALRVMQSGASVINVGSTFGIRGGAGGGAYCVVKSGLIGLTQSIAADYGFQGIRSNIVCPGVIKTAMTQDFWEAPFFQRLNHEMTPMDREGTVEDVANTVYFLATVPGSYINGQTIALDGGWTTTKTLTVEAMTCERVPQG
ncbi:SDR family oxidoreductase [uncultured Abyssibacter sp.]|uniref:SDR family NAD(P)-dependent oxidoreductase n=1 Tax=uncultured Abyssibacter sp. TaxID=2320202 RepID=UPI0032B2A005